MASREGHGEWIDVVNDDESATSDSFQIPRWATFVGILCPDIDAGAVYLHVSADDSTFVPIVDPIDGDDYVLVKSGSDPCYADISSLVAAVPVDWYLRFLHGTTQTTAAVTYKVCFRP